jgi:primosomal protein N' (replication factor Y)
MFAHIIPLRRFPRTVHAFDYAVPESLQGQLCIGQIVRIPMRKTHTLGIVAALSETCPYEQVKEIKEIVQETPLLHADDLTYATTLAIRYGVSPSTLILMMLPPKQPRKISKLALPAPRSHGSTQHQLRAERYLHEEERLAYLRTCIAEGPTMIMLPTHEDAEQCLSLLSAYEPVLYTAGMSQKEQFTAWEKIRTQQPQVIIATRSGMLLPVQSCTHLIIDLEHDDDHKAWEGSPRIDVRALLTERAAQLGAIPHLLSPTPSLHAYHAVYRSGAQTQTITSPLTPLRSPIILDLAQERQAHHYGIFSLAAETAMTAVATNKQDDLVIVCSRKGYASAVTCDACGHTPACPTCNFPLVYHQERQTLSCHACAQSLRYRFDCPVHDCSGRLMELRGAGTELVESVARSMLGDVPHHIIRIEGDRALPENLDEETPRILIGTHKVLRAMRPEQTGMVLFADIDTMLTMPEFGSTMRAWHTLMMTRYTVGTDVPIYLQTKFPESTLIRSLAEPDRLYRTELHARLHTAYPPYQRLVRIIITERNKRAAAEHAETLYHAVQPALTKAHEDVTIRPPIELHPPQIRGNWRYGLTIHVPHTQIDAVMQTIYHLLPTRGVVVDLDPITLTG